MYIVQELAYTMVLGLPVIVWMGMLTFILLVSTATIGYGLATGKIHTTLTMHKRFAATTILIAVIHATFGISIYIWSF